MKKTVALILAFCMCFLMLFSCTGTTGGNAVEIDGGKGVSINFVYLLTAMNKTMYASAVEQSTGGNWNSVVYPEEGITWADLLMQVVLEDAENFLICEYLFDNVYSLELSTEEKMIIDEEYEKYVAAAGSEKNFEDLLSEYSADKAAFKRYLELTVKQLRLQDYLYGTDGIARIADERVKETFVNEYAIVTHIYFNTVTAETADGKIISLDEETAAQKKALAENVYNSLAAGEDFYALKAQYTEDKYESDYYPNGFFVTNDSTFPTAFTTAALEMKAGECRLVDSGNGLHIMYKKSMDESLYNSDPDIYNKIYSRLVSTDFSALMQSHLGSIKISDNNLDLIASINVQNVPGFVLPTE